MSTEVLITGAATPQSLAELYRDLHAHPELSYAEHRTADIVARSLAGIGFEVHTGIGGTGVVGLLSRGSGPTVLLRADMYALPVAEDTGLPYASTARGIDPAGQDVPVMHAELADVAGVPCVYWILGGADPTPFAGASTPEQLLAVMGGIPSNHSPGYAPVIEPTISVGVAALVAAAKEWLARG